MASRDHAHTASAGLDAGGFCELCGEPIDAEEVCVEAFEVTGFLTCQSCLEDMLDASTHSARAEVGMVGGGH